MKYVISSIFSFLAVLLLSAAAYCGYKAVTDEITWGFVMVGLMFPTALAFLISSAAFSAAREY